MPVHYSYPCSKCFSVCSYTHAQWPSGHMAYGDHKIEQLVEAGVVVSESLIVRDFMANEEDILLQASQMFESSQAESSSTTTTSTSNRFGSPVKELEIEKMKQSGIPDKTKQSTAWALKVWNSWANSRTKNEESENENVLVLDFFDMEEASMAIWLPRFVLEVRKENKENYPPGSIYSICCGLQRELRFKERNINIFTDGPFIKFRQVLDSLMKKLNSSGRFQKIQADVITEEIEDRLWDLKVLGDSTPQSLLDNVFYYVGLCFALRGGKSIVDSDIYQHRLHYMSQHVVQST